MSKKLKVVIAIGGTGGHVFPGYHLAEHLTNENYDIHLITDKRGNKYLEKLKKFKTTIIPSSPIKKGNVLFLLYSIIIIIYSFLRSLIFLILNRPKLIFGMGGYASFPTCIAASILNIKFIIYENNLIIGKANKYLLPFARIMFVSYKNLEGIPSKYSHKIFEIGNIINKEIINFSKTNVKKDGKKVRILILGGSQAAKIFAETLPNIFRKCLDKGISLKLYQHCLINQTESLKMYYSKYKIDFKTFNFSERLIDYFSKVDFAITRSGASMLAELVNANIPFISVPLPTSADNHQLKNAYYYKHKKFGFLIEEKDLENQLFNLINEINEDSSILLKIKNLQRQYSDKKVYDNINQILRKLANEKN